MNPLQNDLDLTIELAWNYYQNQQKDLAVSVILDSLESDPESPKLQEALAQFTGEHKTPAIELPKPTPEIVHPQLQTEKPLNDVPAVPPSLEERIAQIFKMPADELQKKVEIDLTKDDVTITYQPSAPESKPQAVMKKKKRHPDEDVIKGLNGEMPDRRACVKRYLAAKKKKTPSKTNKAADIP